MVVSKGRIGAALAAVALVGVAILAWGGSRPAAPRAPLGLFTSLPIYWGESASVNEALDNGAEQHWARRELETAYRLAPLDTLDARSLAALTDLLMAQPRPLAPGENVALDAWVRGGGRLLLFADPFLTEESRFGLGDKRRPQDTVLLSPILARWGLTLTFDDTQPDSELSVGVAGAQLPVRIAGRWRQVAPGAPTSCTLATDGLVARCRIGKGHVLAIADAALLEANRGRSPALAALAHEAFAQ